MKVHISYCTVCLLVRCFVRAVTLPCMKWFLHDMVQAFSTSRWRLVSNPYVPSSNAKVTLGVLTYICQYLWPDCNSVIHWRILNSFASNTSFLKYQCHNQSLMYACTYLFPDCNSLIYTGQFWNYLTQPLHIGLNTDLFTSNVKVTLCVYVCTFSGPVCNFLMYWRILKKLGTAV